MLVVFIKYQAVYQNVEKEKLNLSLSTQTFKNLLERILNAMYHFQKSLLNITLFYVFTLHATHRAYLNVHSVHL